MALDFVSSKSDMSLFIYKHGQLILYTLIYVDDILVTRNSLAAVTSFIRALSSEFAIKDLGKINFFLGVEVIPTSNGLFLSQ